MPIPDQSLDFLRRLFSTLSSVKKLESARRRKRSEAMQAAEHISTVSKAAPFASPKRKASCLVPLLGQALTDRAVAF